MIAGYSQKLHYKLISNLISDEKIDNRMMDKSGTSQRKENGQVKKMNEKSGPIQAIRAHLRVQRRLRKNITEGIENGA